MHQRPLQATIEPAAADAADHDDGRIATNHRLALWGWALYLLGSPWYVLPSGNPQPADLVLATVIAGTALGLFGRLAPLVPLYWASGLFLLIVVNVNLFWWTIYQDEFFLKSILFYVYDLGILIFVAHLFHLIDARTVCRVTALGLAGAIGLETLVMLIDPSVQGERAIGTFNNPNQLGYWALLAAACWLVARSGERLGVQDLAILAAVTYLASLSLSRAAMVALGVMLVLALLVQRLERGWLAGALGALVLAVPLLIVHPHFVREQLSGVIAHGPPAQVIEKLQSIGKQNDDSLDARGYGRLWTHPEHLFLGAGEGAYQRFDETGADMELHSTWATVLFSYGIPGTLAFLFILYTIFRNDGRGHLLYFLPIALYGLTHQGLRSSLFWAFLGLVIGLSWQARAQR